MSNNPFDHLIKALEERGDPLSIRAMEELLNIKEQNRLANHALLLDIALLYNLSQAKDLNFPSEELGNAKVLSDIHRLTKRVINGEAEYYCNDIPEGAAGRDIAFRQLCTIYGALTFIRDYTEVSDMNYQEFAESILPKDSDDE